MVFLKRKAVVNAYHEHLRQVEGLIQSGSYRSLSEFVRDAMGEKLERLAADRVAEQVAQYCALETHDGDDDIRAEQAFDDEPNTRAKR